MENDIINILSTSNRIGTRNTCFAVNVVVISVFLNLTYLPYGFFNFIDLLYCSIFWWLTVVVVPGFLLRIQTFIHID
jgi:hypothetical protein